MIGQMTEVECITEHGHGDYDKAIILVNGERLTPDESLKVRRHSPTGFAWGYAGSGPAQLALAILLEAGVEPEVASSLHQDFKRSFIETLPQNHGWKFIVDIDAWVSKALAKRG